LPAVRTQIFRPAPDHAAAHRATRGQSPKFDTGKHTHHSCPMPRPGGMATCIRKLSAALQRKMSHMQLDHLHATYEYPPLTKSPSILNR
jgi:hypothetical protein